MMLAIMSSVLDLSKADFEMELFKAKSLSMAASLAPMMMS